jgi:hypothetical protein
LPLALNLPADGDGLEMAALENGGEEFLEFLKSFHLRYYMLNLRQLVPS